MLMFRCGESLPCQPASICMLDRRLKFVAGTMSSPLPRTRTLCHWADLLRDYLHANGCCTHFTTFPYYV